MRRRSALARLGFAAFTATAIGAVAVLPMDDYTIHILVQTATFAIAVFGLTVVLGLCGQINLAQAAFFGLGAYAVGLGTAALHLNFWLSMLMGLGLAIVAGALLGMTTLRLGGHYLAMVTISFQQIMTLVMVNWIPVTRGPDGVSGILRPAPFESAHAYLGLCILATALVGYVVWHLPHTRLGRAMRAVRDNELAASVAGINVYRVKVTAFALSAVLGALGGGLFSSGFAYVSPDQFSFAESIVFITMALLGGVSSPIGALIGTALLIVLPESLRFLKSVPGLYLAIYGMAIILIIRYMPDGIWGFVQDRVRRWMPAPAFTGPPAGLVLATQNPRNRGAEVASALVVQGLSKHFGGVKAVDGVSFSVRRGGVHALIGPNGSGKTTTLNVLSGLYTATAGRVVLGGVDISRLPAHARTTAGLGRTFQNIRLFRSMTALENVVIGAERGHRRDIDHAQAVQLARSALDFVGLERRANELVTGFSYGHQRLIEIARALAGQPTLLLLDEPGAGLNSSEKLALRDLLRRIADKGLTILIIDHDMTLVTEVAQQITVLNFGRHIADGGVAQVLQQPDVIAAYLGSEPDAPALP